LIINSDYIGEIFMKLIITGRAGAGNVFTNPITPITHIVSIGANDRRQQPPKGFKEYPAKKLRLEFFDINEAKRGKMNGPVESDIIELIEFFKEALSEEDTYFLIHCWQGISRSTAAGLILLEMYHKDKEKAREELFKLVPSAWPNGRMIKLANKILENVD
jgi:predicted protein tyrosine phosphatase